MQCPKCGYEMDAFDAECPRCKNVGPPPPAQQGPPPPPTATFAPQQQFGAAPPPPAYAQPAYGARPIPEDIRSIRFLWAAFLWGWIWCIGNQVWWALYWYLGFVAAQIVFAVLGGVAGAASGHQGAQAGVIVVQGLSSLVSLGNLAFGIWFAATRAATDAWNARPFRDSTHFRQTQHTWLIVWLVLSAIWLVIIVGVVVFAGVMIARHGFPG